MYDYTRRCRRFVFEGNELLRFSASFPSFEESSAIGDFYSGLAERCESFCESEYFPRLCESFERQKAERSRSVSKAKAYRFSAEVEEETGGVARILLEVSLSRDGRNTERLFSETRFWSLENGMIVNRKSKSST